MYVRKRVCVYIYICMRGRAYAARAAPHIYIYVLLVRPYYSDIKTYRYGPLVVIRYYIVYVSV